MDYESFSLSDQKLKVILNRYKSSFINEYYKLNGTYPSIEEINNVKIPESDLDLHKRYWYSKYLVKKSNGDITGEGQFLPNICGKWYGKVDGGYHYILFREDNTYTIATRDLNGLIDSGTYGVNDGNYNLSKSLNFNIISNIGYFFEEGKNSYIYELNDDIMIWTDPDDISRSYKLDKIDEFPQELIDLKIMDYPYFECYIGDVDNTKEYDVYPFGELVNYHIRTNRCWGKVDDHYIVNFTNFDIDNPYYIHNLYFGDYDGVFHIDEYDNLSDYEKSSKYIREHDIHIVQINRYGQQSKYSEAILHNLKIKQKGITTIDISSEDLYNTKWVSYQLPDQIGLENVGEKYYYFKEDTYIGIQYPDIIYQPSYYIRKVEGANLLNDIHIISFDKDGNIRTNYAFDIWYKIDEFPQQIKDLIVEFENQ